MVSWSYNQVAVRLPRLLLIAWCKGESTCISTNAAPTKASGPARGSPRWTAPTRTPIAIANTAGSRPLKTNTVHQTDARPRSAWANAPKNFEPLLSSNLRNIIPSG